MTIEQSTAKSIIENLLLVSDKPLTADKILEVLENQISREDLKKIMVELVSDFQDRSIQIAEIAMGFQLCTRQEYSKWVKRFHKIEKGSRLSQAALETLSIIAYRQPITRIEIDTVRGVDSSGVVKSLMDKKLIRGMGRKKVIGKPLMIGTSKRFLEYFGLRSIADLPAIEEFKETKENIFE